MWRKGRKKETRTNVTFELKKTEKINGKSLQLLEGRKAKSKCLFLNKGSADQMRRDELQCKESMINLNNKLNIKVLSEHHKGIQVFTC